MTASATLDKTKFNVRWRETYLSEGVNKQALGMASGIYRGMWFETNNTVNLRIVIDPDSIGFDAQSFAIVSDRANGYAIGYSDADDPILIDCTSYLGGSQPAQTLYVWLEAAYTTGADTTGAIVLSNAAGDIPSDGAELLGIIEVDALATTLNEGVNCSFVYDDADYPRSLPTFYTPMIFDPRNATGANVYGFTAYGKGTAAGGLFYGDNSAGGYGAIAFGGSPPVSGAGGTGFVSTGGSSQDLYGGVGVKGYGGEGDSTYDGGYGLQGTGGKANGTGVGGFGVLGYGGESYGSGVIGYGNGAPSYTGTKLNHGVIGVAGDNAGSRGGVFYGYAGTSFGGIALYAEGGVPSVSGVGGNAIYAVGGAGNGFSGGYGINARGGTPSGTGIFASGAFTGSGAGIIAVGSGGGYASSPDNEGIIGKGGTGDSIGVKGIANDDGFGVLGLGEGASIPTGSEAYGAGVVGVGDDPDCAGGVFYGGDATTGDGGYGAHGIGGNSVTGGLGVGVHGAAYDLQTITYGSIDGQGVVGTAGAGVGVYGESTSNVGVEGYGNGIQPGVKGSSASGAGVQGTGGGTAATYAGVVGLSDSSGGYGVYGRGRAAGYAGVYGEGYSGDAHGVLGVGDGDGAGVMGLGEGASQSALSAADGAGVVGVGASAGGVGGCFAGADDHGIYAIGGGTGVGIFAIGATNTAPIRLNPRSTDPSSVSNGDMWFRSSEVRVRVGGTTYILDMTAAP
jgi:hypothetical protein